MSIFFRNFAGIWVINNRDMNKYRIVIYYITVVCMIAFATRTAVAANNVNFDKDSKLAEGRWVKIATGESGIYEISYDELRAAGFEDPSKVTVFGRGGKLQPLQFIPDSRDPDKEEPYAADIQAVAMLHLNNKIYFYGQGVENIVYQPEADRRFIRKSVNQYTTEGYYFLSDIKGYSVGTTAVKAVKPQNTETASDQCFDYWYHEIDSTHPMGTTWVGEDFKASPSQSFMWEIPGAIPSAPGSIEVSIIQSGYTPEKTTMSVNSSKETILTSIFESLIDVDYFSRVATPFKAYSPTGDKGTLNINFAPEGNGNYAYLDYIIVAATKQLCLQPGQTQSRAFVSSSSDDVYKLSNLTPTTRVWEVASQSNIRDLGVWRKTSDSREGYIQNLLNANVSATDIHTVLMIFDTAKEQMHPRFIGEIANQNLHAMETADLVIVTTSGLKEKAEELARLHREADGIDVAVVESSQLINEFAGGTPDAMAYRGFCKMMYDREPGKLKNILLFGPIYNDNRKILQNHGEQLISFMHSTREQSLTGTFMLNDYYGMMSDTYKYPVSSTIDPVEEAYWYNRVIQLGVGVLPVQNEQEADIVIKKIAHYMADDSFGYWGNFYQWTSDHGDEYLHLKGILNIKGNVDKNSSNDLISLQAHVSCYPTLERPVHKQYVKNLDQGALFSAYLGHGMWKWISSVQHFNDNPSLKNDRLTFMAVGGCSITEFESGIRGVIDNKIFNDEYGYIGAMLSNRPAWADDNRKLLLNFFNSTVLEDSYNSLTKRLSTPKTVGEIYALSKTNTRFSSNKFAYHLICDPALRIPLPTLSVDPDNEITTLEPGCPMEISGKIQTHQGEPISDFEGYVVINVMAPETTMHTNADGSSSGVDVTFQDVSVMTVSLSIKGGKFSGILNVPANIATYEGQKVRLMYCAYDTQRRELGVGNDEATVATFDSEKAEIDTESPVVTEMRVNEGNGEIVTGDFTLYVTATDNMGMNISSGTVLSSLTLAIDNNIIDQAQRYAMLDDMGKTMKMKVPFRDIKPGMHRISLRASDLSGNGAECTIMVNVSDGKLCPTLSMTSTVARTEAELTIASGNDMAASSSIIIMDMKGNVVRKAQATGDCWKWDLTDNNGNRVAAGVYNAICVQQSALFTGSSTPIEVVVLGD